MATIAIIGTGWGRRVQVPLFREAGLEIAGIAGFHRNRTERAAAELGVPAFDDWRAILDSDVDIVSIAAPPSEHLEIGTAVLESGKHVINEKPTALDAAEAAKLLDVSRQHPDRIAIVDHELRFLPAWRAARERIGDLGALRYVEVRYASPGRGDRNREWNWWSDAARGGGIWGAVGSHFIDTIRYLGFEIEAAQAELRTIIAERPFGEGMRPVTADDFASVHLRLDGNASAVITLSAVASGTDEPAMTTIHGEHGAYRLVGEELLYAKPAAPYERIVGGELQKLPGNSPGGAFGTGTLLLGRALRAAIDEGDRSALSLAATFEDGLAQQRVLDAARRSAQTEGRWTETGLSS
ncbi:MAG TPA: Gfo/Idh/MocA family oxidoreductase [Thermoanaerobaculia bacterium]|nr:Gfo/Idh/MocA family oxidoreductase [Thermoanaerobaculia bacterium]